MIDFGTLRVVAVTSDSLTDIGRVGVTDSLDGRIVVVSSGGAYARPD